MIPQFSAYDPAAEGEGSIDPLGLETEAERLAERLMPGVTARMHRVRMLTFMAVSAHVTEPFSEEFTADQTTPAYLVFEWMFAEAMWREGVDTSGLPGSQTTDKVRRSHGHLAARVYLKSPRDLGVHGFYRRLARITRVIDDSDWLDENGDLLLRAWERDQSLDGFIDGSDTEGGRVLAALRSDVARGLKLSRSALRETSRGGMALRRRLTPEFPRGSGRERKALRRLLEEDERRAQTLELLKRGLDEHQFDASERDMARWIARNAAKDLANSARVLLAYEDVARLLTDAFELLLWSSTEVEMTPRTPAQLCTDGHGAIAKKLPGALDRLSSCSEKIDDGRERDQLVEAFSQVRSAKSLVEELLARHYEVQARKTAQGKRPWLERTETGVAVRPAYGRDTQPHLSDEFVHPARLSNGCEFVKELGKVR